MTQPSLTVTTQETKQVKYLQASMGVRYYEDATINGIKEQEDIEPHQSRLPLINGECWDITIDMETGQILDWPEGTTAETHFKVCDAGEYKILDADKTVVAEKEGYVPSMLCPKDKGFGDYVILEINEKGFIDGWKVDLSEFESEQS